jgi:hypothetical protein
MAKSTPCHATVAPKIPVDVTARDAARAPHPARLADVARWLRWSQHLTLSPADEAIIAEELTRLVSKGKRSP